MALAVVTGYIPIRGHPRSAAEYGKLGERIFTNLGPTTVYPFYETLEECWLWRYARGFGRLTCSEGDNPAKNTLAYHCVQHQKFSWLLKAAVKLPAYKTFVWIDYGIAHVPGVTPEIVYDFLGRVAEGDYAIPGCWPRENAIINDFFPCWRFCGGLMVVPALEVYRLFEAVARGVRTHLAETGNISWEVNTLARVEATLPLRQYQADHNETMFTNYQPPGATDAQG